LDVSHSAAVNAAAITTMGALGSAALGALGSRLESVALDALLGACQELRLLRATLPP
jgi:hypothetical protein